MYNNTKIIECLAGLVGFEPSYYSEHPPVDADLLGSSSGIRVGPALHPLLVPENVFAIAEQFSKVNVRVFDPAITYVKGEIVKEGSDVYYSRVDNNVGNTPSTSVDQWQKTNLYSAYLRKLYNASCLKLLSRMFTDKKMQGVAKTLLADLNLYEGTGNINTFITKQSRVVGYKIRIRNADTAAIINYIGMQVNQAQSPLTLYLYHSSSDAAIDTIELQHTRVIQFQWHKLPTAKILSFLDDNVNAGGSWYLVYYEDQLTGDAIKKDVSFSGQNTCGTCSENVINARRYADWSKYVSIQPFYVPASYADNITHKLWDETKEIYVDDYNWGINLQISVQCDVTSWFCQNRDVMTSALVQQLTVDLLQEMTYSLRDNQKRERVAGLAAVALDNQENGQYGEAKKLEKTIEALSFDFSGMNSVCLPCGTKGVKLKSVWS